MTHFDFWTGPWNAKSVALAAAIGTMLGLLPKGNLLAVLLLLSIIIFRVNVTVAVLLAVGVSFFAGRLDGVAEKIGDAILAPNFFEPFGQWLFAQKIVPWTSLDNTVVLGNFFIGCVLFVPIYYCVKLLLDFRNKSC